MFNNYNEQAPSRGTGIRFPTPFKPDEFLVKCFSVARVQLKTSKGITDLLLP